LAAKQYVLRIAGINHMDPAMRGRLINLLAAHKVKFGSPDFIAVEWDERVFKSVSAKRERFRSLLKREWPNFSEKLLNILVLSLGYEGDSHLQVYPGVEILWLDQGRQYPLGFKEKCAEWRLRDYKRYLKALPANASETEILSQMRQAASNVPPPQPCGRDKRFADAIKNKSIGGARGWAIAIVGDDHARRDGGSMRGHLEMMGYKCEVRSLT
jgi:hypothetical protein